MKSDASINGPRRRTWTATPYIQADLPAIAAFFKRQYHGSGTYGSLGLFHWKIVQNYVRPGIINLVKDGDEIVCTMSVTPKHLFLMGAEQSVGEIGDIYTDPRYQRQGMFALLANASTREALEAGMSLIYGLPNQEAQPGWEKRAGYRILSRIGIRSLMLPLNVRPLIQRKSHWLLGLWAGTVYMSFFQAYFLTRRAMTKSKPDIEKIDDLPDNWDDFWDQARKRYDFIVSRDRRALKWRFFESPDKYGFYVARQAGKITGYLVTRSICDSEAATLYLADFLFLPDCESDLTALILVVLGEALKGNATKINAWCTRGNPCYRILRNFGFMDRSGVPIIVYWNDLASQVEETCSNWHFTIGNSDNI
jgi:hypothetical protein